MTFTTPKAAFCYTYRKKKYGKNEYVSCLETKEACERHINTMNSSGSTYELVQVFQLVPVETDIEYTRISCLKIKEK